MVELVLMFVHCCAQMGGELTDFVIVLRNFKALKDFSSPMHFSFWSCLSVATGPLGRVLDVDIQAEDEGTTSYKYSSSKGNYVQFFTSDINAFLQCIYINLLEHKGSCCLEQFLNRLLIFSNFSDVLDSQ